MKDLHLENTNGMYFNSIIIIILKCTVEPHYIAPQNTVESDILLVLSCSLLLYIINAFFQPERVPVNIFSLNVPIKYILQERLKIKIAATTESEILLFLITIHAI